MSNTRNNSRSGATAPKGRVRKSKKKKKHPKLSFALKILFLLLLLGILAGMSLFYFKYGNTLLQWQAEAKEVVDKSTVDTFKASETSFVYAASGKPIAKLKGDKDSYYLNFDEIPQYVKDSFIATEDRDFYEHSGFDPKATVSAAFTLVRSKLSGSGISRGGSTITQQLARGTFLSTDQTYERKIREIFIAIDLEKKYTKDQILEFYINNVNYSSGYYGIEAAARGYFSKSASQLTLSECAFLCAIPNRPMLYDPFEHFDNTVSRKGRILKQLLSEGFITAAEYSDAAYEDVVLNPAEDIKSQDYLTTYAVSCATKALMAKQGFEFRYEFNNTADKKAYDDEYSQVYDECYSSLHTSGYNIYTSLSKKVQRELQQSVNQQLAGFKEKKDGVYTLQGAAACISNKTGRVVAIVGGRKQNNMTGYSLNRGYQSYRQPGSSFKPLVVYTPQLERGYTADSIVDDNQFEGGPRNSDGSYLGKIPLRTAVEKSKNVVAWRLFQELTPAVGLSYILNMNFNRIVDSDYVPAASLGGLTNGVSTVEMASGYATLANGGVYREPTCITKITDSEGNIVLRTKKLLTTKQVYKKNAAHAMTDILEGVLIRGTAAGKGLDNMACAGKTGTTSDKKDGWFCGYTPYYSTAVWVGYDAPKTLDDLYGSTYPLSIWRQFMGELHSGLEYADFDMSNGDDTSNNDGGTTTNESTTRTKKPKETVDPDAIDPDTVETEAPTLAPTVAPENGGEQIPPKETTGAGGDNTTPEDVGNETTTEDVGNGN